MSSKKDKKEQEPQTEEVKEEKVEAAAEEIKDEAKAESKEDKKDKKQKKESKKEAEIKETAEKLIQAEKEKYLRLCAEYDNFRKRSQREREQARKNLFHRKPSLSGVGVGADIGQDETIRLGGQMDAVLADAK